MRKAVCFSLTPILLLFAQTAFAHATAHDGDPAAILNHWDFSAAVILPLLIASGLYYTGLYRAWQGRGRGKIISIPSAISFAAGIFTLLLALMSPIDAVSGVLFSVHMIQHLLLILVAAPLLVLGAPDMALLWALPRSWRHGYGRFCSRFGGALNNETGDSAVPLLVTLLATGVLWIWHLPALYDLAVANEAIHYSEHVAFVVTAALFWATILRLRPRDHQGNGLRILYVFGMALQGSVLGALLTIASRPLYQSHKQIPPDWLLTPLLDQKLAGVIMWVPPVLLYILVIGYLFYRWLQHSDRLGHRVSKVSLHSH